MHSENKTECKKHNFYFLQNDLGLLNTCMFFPIQITSSIELVATAHSEPAIGILGIHLSIQWKSAKREPSSYRTREMTTDIVIIEFFLLAFYE